MAVRVPQDIRLPTRYQVSRVIGRGGAAVVLQARDLRLQREVAVKVFTQAASTAEVLIDQEREAQLLARSAHPNLVTIFDVASDRGPRDGGQHLFLVMEYVDGPDLAQWLRLQRASVRQVLELGIGLCAALQFVHRKGVLHCDIKPSNVLLQVGQDGELTPKLADFGIAAVLQGQVPQGEFTVGTAAYLSPEQVEGDPLQEPSDVYALGLVLLEAASGQVAFPGAVVDSALARLDRDPLIDDRLPLELVEVLRGMTQRRPEQRWSLTDARAAFWRMLHGVPPELADLPSSEAPVEPVPVEDTIAPALRTLGPDGRMPALDRAVDLAAGVVGARGACLVTTESDETVVQAVHALTSAEVAALVQRALGGGAGRDGLRPVPITASRGDRLGWLIVDQLDIDEEGYRLLGDVAFLAGQVLELRAATRRALLSH